MTPRLLIIAVLLFAVNQFSGTNALAAAVIKAVNRSDESARLQLFLHLDQLPDFHLTTNGRRINLELPNTLPADSMAAPATDGKMIKMVSTVEKNTTTLSFYFRYPPQKVVTETNKETGLLMLDVLLGNQLSASYPELSSKLQGVRVVRRGVPDSLNPVNSSQYAQNWRSFFTQYSSSLEILPPPRFHLPPFPLAEALPPQTPTEKWLPEDITAQAKEGNWPQVGLLVYEQVARQSEEHYKERLVLTYAEALVRAGEYKEPYFLLQRIILQYPDTLMADLAHFLLIYQQAARGEYIDAYYEFRSLLQKIGDTAPLTASFNLLHAELALMAGHSVEAEHLLADQTINHDAPGKQLRQLRQTDLLAEKNEHAKALTAYLDLAGHSALLNNDPMSLARFANILYDAQRYGEAVKQYHRLADLLNNQPGQELALFRQAMCQLHVPGAEKKARIDLQQIHNAFPGTEGGVRAQIKLIDLDYLTNKMTATEAEALYGKYAVEAQSIALREEAAFKQALVNALAGNGEVSVTQCMEMLRGFQSGKLRTETLALLIQQLPGVVRQMVKKEEYVKALVLAKKNKAIFARGWLDTNLLFDLARAYNKLGMTEQTAQTYKYLFEVSPEADKEKIYLPLIEALSASGNFMQVEEYADRYQLRYPKGGDLPAIFALKIRALYASGQLEKTLKLLISRTGPRIPELELIKGRIYLANKEWQKVIDTLTQPGMQDWLAKNAMLLPLAESYFQTGNDEQAAAVFQRISTRPEGGEQAQFRLAQIASKKGNKQQALNLFKGLADKGTDPFWTKLSREEAAIIEINQR